MYIAPRLSPRRVVIVRDELKCVEESRVFGINQSELLDHSVDYIEEDVDYSSLVMSIVSKCDALLMTSTCLHE